MNTLNTPSSTTSNPSSNTSSSNTSPSNTSSSSTSSSSDSATTIINTTNLRGAADLRDRAPANCENFTDVASYPRAYQDAIYFLKCTLPFFTGNADGTFQGDNFLNRAEIAAIGARAEYTDAEIAQLSADRDIPFPDLLRQEWFTGSAIMSQSLGFIDGLGENHPTMPGYFDAAGNLDVLQAMKLFITIPARHYPVTFPT